MADAVNSTTVPEGLLRDPAIDKSLQSASWGEPLDWRAAVTAVLDDLWTEVNALGGVPEPGDGYSLGYCNAIEQALGLIEARGAGRQPASCDEGRL